MYVDVIILTERLHCLYCSAVVASQLRLTLRVLEERYFTCVLLRDEHVQLVFAGRTATAELAVLYTVRQLTC